jgi:hypothetical protein
MSDPHASASAQVDDEPKTPMWLPGLGATLFVAVGLWWAVTPGAPPPALDTAASASASVSAPAPAPPPPPATRLPPPPPPPSPAQPLRPRPGPGNAPPGMQGLPPGMQQHVVPGPGNPRP